MSNDDVKLNILELPNEVLREILEYVPDQFTVGQVCKTFYFISCKLKAYKLHINGIKSKTPTTTIVDLEKDDDIYENILRSSRRIDTISIQFAGLLSLKMTKVIKHIGENVKHLEIRDSYLNIYGILLINLMPNLEKLDILDVTWGELENTHLVDFKLRLNKLKDLAFYNACDELLEAFDRLPDNVLNKLRVDSDQGGKTFEKYFLNQRSIKHFDGKIFTKLSGLKLKTLRLIYSEENAKDTLNALRGQVELTSLEILNTLKQMPKDILNFICYELKALKELELDSFETESFVDLSKLQRLRNLKSLTLGRIDVETAKTIKSISLVKFNCGDFPEEVHLFLATNCPNLRELNIGGEYENFDVEQFTANCPKLERLKCDVKNFVFSAGWENQSIKHLRMWIPHKFSENTFEFMKRCKNLKTVSILKADTEDLKRLLIENPNLTTLCLFIFATESAGIIMEHGENIECYHQGLPFYGNVEKAYDKVDEVKNVLRDKLPVYKLVNEYYCTLEFSMKKYGKIEKCCESLEKMWKNKIK